MFSQSQDRLLCDILTVLTLIKDGSGRGPPAYLARQWHSASKLLPGRRIVRLPGLWLIGWAIVDVGPNAPMRGVDGSASLILAGRTERARAP